MATYTPGPLTWIGVHGAAGCGQHGGGIGHGHRPLPESAHHTAAAAAEHIAGGAPQRHCHVRHLIAEARATNGEKVAARGATQRWAHAVDAWGESTNDGEWAGGKKGVGGHKHPVGHYKAGQPSMLHQFASSALGGGGGRQG